MIEIHKKIVVDENGNQMEVIIPWNEYNEMEELLGLDLDKSAIEDLKQAQKDRTSKKKDAYLDIDTNN
ncbi:MAG: hypothetical protein V3T79_00190 [Candidatus Scalindua sediminis]|jgi:PHD/YefM family antitoxin component YafN of YafNO toxin-antitoxin module